MAMDYEKFMLKQAEWRGEVSANIIDIKEDIKEMKKDIKDIKGNNRARDIKTAKIAGSISILTTLVISVFLYLFQKGII